MTEFLQAVLSFDSVKGARHDAAMAVAKKASASRSQGRWPGIQSSTRLD
jgi:hypothetical protein